MLFLLLHLVLLVLQWWQVIVTVIAVLITTDLVYKTCFQLFCLPKKTPNISWYFYITLILTVLTSTVGESTVLTSFSLGESQISNSSSRFFFRGRCGQVFGASSRPWMPWMMWRRRWVHTFWSIGGFHERYGKHMGKPWKNMEKYGKSMGKHGKVWDIACDIAH